MFLVGQNVFYGSGCAGLAYLEHSFSGMAKAIQSSYAYPYQKCREKDAKPSSDSDTEDTLKKE